MAALSTAPLFSILMPTHNRAEIVGLAIKSVLAQTERSFELLVVGDGCTDDTEAVVTQLAQQDKRVKWLPFPKAPGFGYAHRNVALKQARGKYAAFAAHDDLWFPDHLEHLLAFFTAHPEYDIAYTRPLWVHPDGSLVPSLFNTNAPPHKAQLLFQSNEIPAHCVAQTMASLAEIGYWNVELPEAADWDVWRRTVLSDPDQKLGFISVPTALHFRAKWRTESTSGDPYLKATHAELQRMASLFPMLAKTDRVTSSDTEQQQVVWQEIQSDSSWVSTVRVEAQALLDCAARYALVQRNQLQEDVSRITSTKGYRFLEWLRHFLRR